MQKKRILDPFLAFLPVIFTLLTIGAEIVWIILAHSTGILTILKIFMPIAKVSTILGLSGFLICLSILVAKNAFLTYARSIPLTLYLHENLKIYKKISDYRKENQPLTYAERTYNACVFNSYIAKKQKTMTVIITVPRNGAAQELLNKNLLNLRKDLVSRFPEYSFGGRFEQVGSYMTLQGSL